MDGMWAGWAEINSKIWLYNGEPVGSKDGGNRWLLCSLSCIGYYHCTNEDHWN